MQCLMLNSIQASSNKNIAHAFSDNTSGLIHMTLSMLDWKCFVLTLKVSDLHTILLLIAYCTVYTVSTVHISVVQHAMLMSHDLFFLPACLIHQVTFSYQHFLHLIWYQKPCKYKKLPWFFTLSLTLVIVVLNLLLTPDFTLEI